MPDAPALPWLMGDLRRATTGTHTAKITPPIREADNRNETLQCFVITPDGDVIISQGFPKIGDTTIEDTWLSLTRKGALVATMRLVGAGHGTLFDQHPDGELVISWAGIGLLKLPFQAGEFKTPEAAGAKPWGGVFRPGTSGVSFDPDHGNVLMYGGNKARVFRFDDVDKGEGGATVFPVLQLPKDEPRLRQGWTIYGDRLLYLVGYPLHDQALDVYDLNAPHLTYSRSARLVSAQTTYHQEPEGVKVYGGKVHIAFTTRPGPGKPYLHMIKTLTAYDGRVPSDAGQFYVDPERVPAGEKLYGYDADGNITQRRDPGKDLWIRRLTAPGMTYPRRSGELEAITGYGTVYPADYLTRTKPQ